jgi:hypothetical protein
MRSYCNVIYIFFYFSEQCVLLVFSIYCTCAVVGTHCKILSDDDRPNDTGDASSWLWVPAVAEHAIKKHNNNIIADINERLDCRSFSSGPDSSCKVQ